LTSAYFRPDQRGIRLAAGAVLAALTWAFAPLGLGAASLLHARARGGRATIGAATVYLGAAVTLFYYQMDVSFSQKSFTLASSGLILLGLALIARVRRSQRNSEPETKEATRDARRSSRLKFDRLAPLAISLAILIVFNAAVFSKENLLRNGRSMLLKLAPVDPLSLMQGWYLRLALAVEREVEMHFLDDDPAEGKAVMIEMDGIAHFARIHRGEPLAAGEFLLIFRRAADGGAQIGGGSFFFEEGSAEAYEEARYAEFRVKPDGESLIANLLDAERRIIRPAETSRTEP
jgi:uncharacterized membrane-anchored protein